MQSISRPGSASAFAMAAVCLAAFAGVAVSCEDSETFPAGILISNEQELEVGTDVDFSIEKQFKIVDPSDPLTAWAVKLVTGLAEGAVPFRDPKEFNGWKVEFIADDELVNAFAAPGGFVYISTGLILNAKKCGEIAGVLSHELAHVTERHGVKQLEKALIAQGLVELFVSNETAAKVIDIAVNVVLSTEFSRDAETQADSVGLQVAYNANYNPYALVDFFAVLLAEEKKGGASVPEFLSSHPATEKRIAEITAEIEKRYADKADPGVTQTYDCLGTSLKLADVQQLIKDKNYAVKMGTGTEPRKNP